MRSPRMSSLETTTSQVVPAATSERDPATVMLAPSPSLRLRISVSASHLPHSRTHYQSSYRLPSQDLVIAIELADAPTAMPGGAADDLNAAADGHAPLVTEDQPERGDSESAIRVRDLVVDPLGGRVWRRGSEVTLTRREFQVLLALVKGKGGLITKRSLLHEVWGFDCAVSTRRIDYQIRALRRKLEEDPSQPEYILTRRGLGWRINVDTRSVRLPDRGAACSR